MVCKTTPPPIDSYQLSIKLVTFGGQIRDQEAAVQQTFHLERTSFSFSTYGTQGLNVTLTTLYFSHSCTKHRPRLLASASENHTPWKPSYIKGTSNTLGLIGTRCKINCLYHYFISVSLPNSSTQHWCNTTGQLWPSKLWSGHLIESNRKQAQRSVGVYTRTIPVQSSLCLPFHKSFCVLGTDKSDVWCKLHCVPFFKFNIIWRTFAIAKRLYAYLF